MNSIVAAVLGAGVIALIFAWLKARSVARAEVGTPRMAEIAGYIREGRSSSMTRSTFPRAGCAFARKAGMGATTGSVP